MFNVDRRTSSSLQHTPSSSGKMFNADKKWQLPPSTLRMNDTEFDKKQLNRFSHLAFNNVEDAKREYFISRSASDHYAHLGYAGKKPLIEKIFAGRFPEDISSLYLKKKDED